MKKIRSDGQDEVTRFTAVGKVIGHWLHVARSGRLTLDEAWDHVQDHNAACIDPPWSEARLRTSFDAIYQRDIANHGPMPDFGPDLPPTDSDEIQSDDDGASASPMFIPDAVFLSEDDLADRFAERFRRKFRHAAARGCWMIWTGRVWKPDERHSAIDKIRLSCRVVAATINDEQMARKLCSQRTITAVEKLARTDPRIAETGNVWDRGPMILNTPNGIIDLATGELKSHDAALLLTRIAGASPQGSCPRWLRFLKEVTGGNQDLVDYLQRVAGYCLTGSMSEQVFFFLHGTGANGKSIFISTLSDVLGDYAATAPLNTFASANSERHPTDLAGLATARAVFVTETEQGKPWAESRIKAITGGDTLRVRFLYRDFFEIDPTFKIIVAGNSRPRLIGVGEAMKRRLHLIPFEVTIPPDAREKDLQDQLHRERDGILAWMLAGCAAWQMYGLAAPDCIFKAAEEYFRDEDLVGQWIEETCTTGDQKRARSSVLYSDWSAWAEPRGFDIGSQRSLGEDLRSRGFKPYRTGKERGWLGLSPIHGSSGSFEGGNP